jgi:hypothetical protein
MPCHLIPFQLCTSQSVSITNTNLQAFLLLGQKLNIVSMPVTIFIKLGMYISCHLRPSRWRISYIPVISNTNTTAPQTVEVIPLILFECQNRSS